MLSTGHEGRAGMAAMIVRPGLTFDGRKLFEHVMRDLPAYARPLFIRLQVTSRDVLTDCVCILILFIILYIILLWWVYIHPGEGSLWHHWSLLLVILFFSPASGIMWHKDNMSYREHDIVSMTPLTGFWRAELLVTWITLIAAAVFLFHRRSWKWRVPSSSRSSSWCRAASAPQQSLTLSMCWTTSRRCTFLWQIASTRASSQENGSYRTHKYGCYDMKNSLVMLCFVMLVYRQVTNERKNLVEKHHEFRCHPLNGLMRMKMTWMRDDAMTFITPWVLDCTHQHH